MRKRSTACSQTSRVDYTAVRTVHFVSTTFVGLIILLQLGCSSVPVTNQPPANAWLMKSLPEIAKGIRDRKVSSQTLVAAYTSRIEEIDRNGPTLRSVLSLNPDALTEAKALDDLQSQGTIMGPLHGVPILLKDNIEAKGALPTTAGSSALARNITNRDSPLVAGLRSAGAIILGKSNLSQWANYRSNHSVSGWSSLGGQVKNPHILDRNPCGSSSGSGAAVAAALAGAAVGTETNGSIICPSNASGIVGFKPTIGLISTQHIVPISFSQDTAGPMTRSVAGAALMLDAMATEPARPKRSYFESLTNASLDGKRFGVLRYAQGNHPGINDRFENALMALTEAGGELIDITQPPGRSPEFGAQARQVLSAEFKYTINQYLAATPPSVSARTLSQLIEFNDARKDLELTLFGQEIFEEANKAVDINNPAYKQALASIQNATRENGIDALLAEYRLDALVFPSGPLAPAIDPINGDVWPAWVGDGTSAAIAGYPHLTVPMGTVRGVPIGLSFVATAGNDAKVLALGHAFEQATQLRVEPSFISTAVNQSKIKAAMEQAPQPVSEGTKILIAVPKL